MVFIVDVDGVLFNTLPQSYHAYREAFAKAFKYDLTWACFFEHMLGNTLEQAIHSMGLRLTPDDVINLREQKSARFEELIIGISPCPKVMRIIEARVAAGDRIIVCTAGSRVSTEQKLKHLTLPTDYTLWAGVNKREPLTWVELCETHNLPPDKCLVLDDDSKVCSAAHKAGLNINLWQEPQILWVEELGGEIVSNAWQRITGETAAQRPVARHVTDGQTRLDYANGFTVFIENGLFSIARRPI